MKLHSWLAQISFSGLFLVVSLSVYGDERMEHVLSLYELTRHLDKRLLHILRVLCRCFDEGCTHFLGENLSYSFIDSDITDQLPVTLLFRN